ncbi:hypothetical protein [Micromonospora sp. NPDC050276]|uniref:hypothetical protein n=1 Tax=Micromonospora sp. NPDC050276 TaxID=3364278 RepID=UPI0037A6B935
MTTRETVAVETPAARATSLIVTGALTSIMPLSLDCNRYRLRFQDVANVTDNDYEHKTFSPSSERRKGGPIWMIARARRTVGRRQHGCGRPTFPAIKVERGSTNGSTR